MMTSKGRIDLTAAGRYGFGSLRMAREEDNESRYFLDDSLIPTEYGHALPPALADLLDIAGSVMWADRTHLRSRDRGRYGMSRGWVRNLPVTLGVREPELWSQPDVKATLTELLVWLTEDQWDFEFEQQHEARRLSDLQPPLFASPPKNVLICLYSGGLDSHAGAVELLLANPTATLVLVSAVHNRQRLRKVIERQVQALRARFGQDRVLFAPMPFHVVNAMDKQSKEEHTQRSRAFLFLSFGVAVAAAFGASEVYICENGVGSLNLPMDWIQLGSQNTRATHPQTIERMTTLMSLVGQPKLTFRMPNMLRTKSEICEVMRSKRFIALVKLTVSCDGFPHRFKSPVKGAQLHCGCCTSCVLRRQAIYAAGLGRVETPTYYRRDLCMPQSGIKPSYFNHLKKMLDQCYLFEVAAKGGDPVQQMQQAFPELINAAMIIDRNPSVFGLQPGQKPAQEIAGMLLRYAAEWQRFPYRLRAD